MRQPAKMECFQAKLVVKDPQARRLFNPEMAQSTSHELNAIPSSIEPIAPASPLVKDLPDLGSLNRSVLPW
jgi:hypothetical protein